MQSRHRILLNSIKIAFTIAFFYFSYGTFRSYIEGAVIYDVINDWNDTLIFPSVTVCPKEQDSLVNLKLSKITEDHPSMSPADTIGPAMFSKISNLQDPLSFVRKYSYNQEEVFYSTGTIS